MYGSVTPTKHDAPPIDAQVGNSVRQLADGTVVITGHTPDGAAVNVTMRAGALEIELRHAGMQWKQIMVYRGSDGSPPEGEPQVMFKRRPGRPRTRPAKLPPVTMDQLVERTH